MKFPPGYIEMIEKAATFIRGWRSARPFSPTPAFNWGGSFAYTGSWSETNIRLLAGNFSATVLLRDLSSAFPDISIMMTQTAWELVEKDTS